MQIESIGGFIKYCMPKILRLSSGYPVDQLRSSLAQHPGLWDRNPARTENPESPHFGLSDIWVRFAPAGSGANQDHRSIWYPAASSLPEVRTIANDLMWAVQGEELGGILITMIPPGATCRPHTDLGWHAKAYEKFALQIESDKLQAFHFEGESLVTAPGDIYWFNNAHLHWVTNDSTKPRITAIFCVKTDSMDRYK